MQRETDVGVRPAILAILKSMFRVLCALQISFTSQRPTSLMGRNLLVSVFMITCNSGVLMTMRKCKLAILAIAVLLQVHTGARLSFWAELTRRAVSTPLK